MYHACQYKGIQSHFYYNHYMYLEPGDLPQEVVLRLPEGMWKGNAEIHVCI